MTIIQLLLLIAVFLLTSMISVVTGSTSLITVPAMLQIGIEPRSAIATNMFALTLMNIGGTLPFLGKNTIDYNRLPLLIVLTLIGSILGALLVLVVPSKAISQIISVSMIAVAVFAIAKGDAGVVSVEEMPSLTAEIAGCTATIEKTF